MAFPFLTVFIIFLLLYYVRRTTLTRRREEREAAFWAREEEAEHTPAKDLSTVAYIQVPLDRFPIGQSDEDELMLIEEELEEVSRKRLLNLNGMTNTDVKIEYGTANFETIVAMGEDFDRLITLLCDYAKGLIEADMEKEAIPVLEYGVEVKSDLSDNYTLLGECYRSLGMEEELAALRQTVESSELPLKDKILDAMSGERAEA